MKIARECGGQAIDVQRTMRGIQTKAWKFNAEKTEKEKNLLLHVPDTIHLNELGQLAIAFAILKGLGAPAEVSTATIDATEERLVESSGCRVSNINRTIDGIEFTRDDNGLPFNNGIFYALNYRFVPVPEELNRYMLAVRNLAPGRYQLNVIGRDVGKFTAKQLDAGINISSATGNGWEPGGPWDAQAAVLQTITDARHNLASSIKLSGAWIADSEITKDLTNQVISSNEKLEQMQKTIAKPMPYRFVLTIETSNAP